MTPWNLSVLSWIVGGVIGAIVANVIRPQTTFMRQHPLARTGAGFVGGMLLIGAVADKTIELYHPGYTGS